MTVRIAELSIKINGQSALHVRSLELQADLASAAGLPIAEHVQLALPSSATDVPTCGECGRRNYHLVSCSSGGAR